MIYFSEKNMILKIYLGLIGLFFLINILFTFAVIILYNLK